MKNNISDEDYCIISEQIGRKPDNLKDVALRCPFSYPAVLLTSPYEESIVFPTSYWLSCPYLVKKVSIIEDQGLIQELTNKLKIDKKFKNKLQRAHEDYAKRRVDLLECKIEALPEGIRDVIVNSGVGGIVDKEGIKCLHTHLADYLVNGKNPVGKIVFNKVDWPDKCDICENFFNE